jgi:hypothetical protein
MEGISSFDLFVVPTIAFQQFFAFLVLGHRRQQLLWVAVIKNPMVEWLARQITEAFPWNRHRNISFATIAFGSAFKFPIRVAWVTWSGMSRLFRTYRAPLSQCAMR